MFCSFHLEIDIMEAVVYITTPVVGADVHHSRCAAEAVGRTAALLRIGCVGVDRSYDFHRTAHCDRIGPGEADVAGHKPALHTQLAVRRPALGRLRNHLDSTGHHKVGCDLRTTAGAVDLALESHSSGLEADSFGVVRHIHLVDAVGIAGAGHNHPVGVDHDCRTAPVVEMSKRCGSESMHAIRWAGTMSEVRYRYTFRPATCCGCSRSRYQTACYAVASQSVNHTRERLAR